MIKLVLCADLKFQKKSTTEEDMETLREQTYKKFLELLEKCYTKNYIDISEESRKILAKNLEKGAYNSSIKTHNSHNAYVFQQNYIRKVMLALRYLNPESEIYKDNPKCHPEEILQNICYKVVNWDIDSFYHKSAENLMPSAERQIVKTELNMIFEDQLRPKTHTGMYKCGKCGSKNTTYIGLQTRAADEPTTIFVNCIDCGKRWRTS